MGDAFGDFTDHLLVRLPTGNFKDCHVGVRADSLRDRARRIVRFAEWRNCARVGNLELPDRDQRLDRLRNFRVGMAIVDRRLQGLSGQVHVRKRFVTLVLRSLRVLPDADDDRRVV
ncbi:hypothetical protein [Erythrobacter sp. JK5]|uniref:hypothetical protein n=1 Tax=Erythrobacter sp. JK5 TaxID=2829500 RepID=UPI002011A0E2|nr:hypothetical protein [Erythrobacter sp. JK5]